MKSQYIQRKRTKGFNLQAASPDGRPVISCTRPGKWGNRHKPVKHPSGFWVRNTNVNPQLGYLTPGLPIMFCVGCYAEDVVNIQDNIQQELQGKHLACYCKVGSPCHVQDILLPIANGLRFTIQEEVKLHWSDGVVTGPNQYYQRVVLNGEEPRTY